MQVERGRIRRRAHVAWWLLGLLNNVGYVIFYTAAEALVEGAAGAVLAADILPTLAIKGTAPLWAHRFSYRARVLLCGGFGLASFLVVAVAQSVEMRLLGVCFASVASGWGEVTLLAYTARFGADIDTVQMWSSGTGFAGIAGALYFWLLSTILLVPTATALYIGCLMPAAYVGVFLWLLPAPDIARQRATEAASVKIELVAPQQLLTRDEASSGAAGSGPASGADARGERDNAALLTASDDLIATDGATSAAAEDDGIGGDGVPTSCCTRLALVKPLLLPFMLPLFLVYFAEYTISTGVVSTFDFSAGMTRPRFFTTAALTYQIGVFISRSSRNWFPLKKLWLLPALQLANLGIMLLQAFNETAWVRRMCCWATADALTRFLLCPQSVSPWPVLGLVFWEGLLGGATYVNAFAMIRESDKLEPQLREFSLGVASVADTCGIVSAAMLSLWLECALNRHNGVVEAGAC